MNYSTVVSIRRNSKPICREHPEKALLILQKAANVAISAVNTHQKRAPYFAKSKRAVCKLLQSNHLIYSELFLLILYSDSAKRLILAVGNYVMLAVFRWHRASFP